MTSIADRTLTNASYSAVAGSSFNEKERSYCISKGALGQQVSVQDAITQYRGATDGELNWWRTQANTSYALGLPTNLSLSDYQWAVLNAGGPT